MSIEYFVTVTPSSAEGAEALSRSCLPAISQLFSEKMGLKVFKEGDDFLYLYHPDTSEAVLEKWGGDILIQCEKSGFFVIFTLGLEHEKYLSTLQSVLEVKGVDYRING